MAPNPVIRSRGNAWLKRVGAVLAGKEPGVVLEGDRLVDDALAAGWAVEVVLVAEERAERAAELGERAEVRLVAGELLARVSALKTAPGVLALAAEPRPVPLADLCRIESALVLGVAGVADPGNLGALARSAEAAGAAGLVVVAGGARPWTAKALRGSMGSLLRLPVAIAADARGAAAELARLGVRQVAAATRGGVSPARFDWSGRVALWVTGETGAPPELGVPLESVTIPMAGAVESLNVTVAASLLLFAAGRAERATSAESSGSAATATRSGSGVALGDAGAVSDTSDTIEVASDAGQSPNAGDPERGGGA